ncbi:hypothetical protein K1T71_014435 [Dendrolimus kikuchii]|uniref:Uncharacterized protein n=1 Tax=Dendrolimus kikuchii TaxID=765133 RepID=A0ACC1CE30_9NEOP|nr:hypothetical protein K1T71_014435 [Dendrolimus kikuchii]
MGLYDSMPEDRLPQCWSDDVRMNALFAPFRLKSVNPESWEMKMKFWSDMIRQWCKHRKDPIITAADAKFAFQRKGRTPACIDIVVEEMFRNGELSLPSKYQQILQNGPESWVRWGARLAFRPAAFALTAVTSLLPGRQAIDSDGMPKASIESTQRFVVESAVKEQATQMLNNYPQGVERIGTIDELLRNSETGYSKELFELLLGWLVSEGYAMKKGDIVKLAEPDTKVTPVSEADEALAKLTRAESRLAGDEVRLARDVAAAHNEARAAVQVGNRIAAKNHLRRKQRAVQRLAKCTAALENVRQLLNQMRDVEDNAIIVDTYKSSTQAMKQSMKDGGLEEDSVHDTMDDLKEVMDTYNEVEKALSTTVDDFDTAELEQELKELLANSGPGDGGTPGKEQKEKITGPKLPTPPLDKPRRKSERDFVFDGEERMLAELNELDLEDPNSKDSRVQERRKKVAVPTDEWIEEEKPIEKSETKPEKESQKWYPPSGECLKSDSMWDNNNRDSKVQDPDDFGDLHQDDRLHPGQPLDMDFSTPPKLYARDFQVRDHKMAAGVWLYNSRDPTTRDANCNVDGTLSHSTEYFSSESPGKSGGNFQMAPGGERKREKLPKEVSSVTEDLERRLRKLRGFNL